MHTVAGAAGPSLRCCRAQHDPGRPWCGAMGQPAGPCRPRPTCTPLQAEAAGGAPATLLPGVRTAAAAAAAATAAVGIRRMGTQLGPTVVTAAAAAAAAAMHAPAALAAGLPPDTGAAAAAAAAAAAYVPSPTEPGWEVWVGAAAGAIPFVVAAVEFGKRVVGAAVALLCCAAAVALLHTPGSRCGGCRVMEPKWGGLMECGGLSMEALAQHDALAQHSSAWLSIDMDC